MSDTIVDMPKVTQMLDNGWQVEIYKNEMGSYAVTANHATKLPVIRQKLIETTPAFAGMDAEETVDLMHFDDDGLLFTDDFTPEQALTRMAYKCHGEIL